MPGWRRSRLRLLRSRVSLTLLATAACEGVTGPNIPASLEKVSGDDQSTVAGTALPQPLVVKVANRSGVPVSGVAVTWAITAGGGSISLAAGAATDGLGQTSAVWTLGTAAGDNAVTATAQGVSGVSFAATSTPDRAAAVRISRDSLLLPALGDTVRLSASVVDRYNNVIASAKALWVSSDIEVVSVDSAGLVRAQKNGVAFVVATSAGNADTARTRVSQQVAGLAVSPSLDTISVVGGTLNLSVATFDRNGYLVVGAPVT